MTLSRSRILIAVFVLASVGIQLWAHRDARKAAPDSGLKGTTAPGVTLSDVEGRTVSLDEFRGKIVILDFWATWCMPCQAEFNVLKPWWQSKAGTGLLDNVAFIAVNVREPREAVKSFRDRMGLPFMVLLDEEASAADQFGVTVLPTLIIIDPAGRVVETTTGFDPTIGQQLTEYIEKMNQEAGVR